MASIRIIKFTPPPGGVETKKPARSLCLHLGKRTEFRAGCGGAGCKHECDAGKPFAVPAGVCQTCPPETESSPGYVPQ